MDPAKSDALETMDRPRRKTNLPSHLDDYEVGYRPAEDPPPKASSHCPSQPRSSSRKPSCSGASSHSRTSRLSVTSTGVYLPPELSSVQTAILEEKIKQRQLDSLRQQVAEDSLADVEYQRLQAQAKEAQHIQEEALRAKEALSKQLERQRKLQQAETELEVAKLVSSMLVKDSGSTTPVPTSSPGSHSSSPQLTTAIDSRVQKCTIYCSAPPVATSSLITSLKGISDCPYNCASLHCVICNKCGIPTALRSSSHVHCCTPLEYKHAVCDTAAAYHSYTAAAYNAIYCTTNCDSSSDNTRTSVTASSYQPPGTSFATYWP
ncbi:circadian locomoter output cycles kaput-like protein [Labeo rohita]|uniref:Circadian locomoter output cycles kaput-like protein n=1 Tax=Labeo rohita TaxID=84645 RepID=A0A498LJ41_LABRO|nr:circadian locomoter output cycles kaput-like protein [Labeo rohita]RXN23219.1 circadian locomoter output cycles kaput-like protein [Labeo rohita]